MTKKKTVFLLLWMWFALQVLVERVRNVAAYAFRSVCFQITAKYVFWYLLSAPGIGGQVPQVFRVPQISTDGWLQKKRLFDEKAERDLLLPVFNGLIFFSVACVKDDLDKVGLPIQTKAEFSCAVTVIDKIGGWEDGKQEDLIGARLGASVWICTKALVCNGQRNMEHFRMNEMTSIT